MYTSLFLNALHRPIRLSFPAFSLIQIQALMITSKMEIKPSGYSFCLWPLSCCNLNELHPTPLAISSFLIDYVHCCLNRPVWFFWLSQSLVSVGDSCFRVGGFFAGFQISLLQIIPHAVLFPTSLSHTLAVASKNYPLPSRFSPFIVTIPLLELNSFPLFSLNFSGTFEVSSSQIEGLKFCFWTQFPSLLIFKGEMLAGFWNPRYLEDEISHFSIAIF